MTGIQVYLDAFYFIIARTNVLMYVGITLAVSITVGVLFLDRFVLWLWAIIFVLFLSITQYQINNAMEMLEYSPYQIAQPFVITIMSAVLFVTGSGLGYWIKVKCLERMRETESPDIVAKEIVAKVNGGSYIENSPNNQNVFLDQEV